MPTHLVQCRPMVVPRIVPRAEHTISRRDVDADALKVLYRLRQADHVALSGRRQRPRSAARATSEGFRHRHVRASLQVKKLFRNCWIIGRRFRLAHVKFGTKVIEVATFRRQLRAGRRSRRWTACRRRDPTTPEGDAPDSPRQHIRHAGRGRVPARLHDQRAVLRHRDVLRHRLRRRARRSAARALSASIGDPDVRAAARIRSG